MTLLKLDPKVKKIVTALLVSSNSRNHKYNIVEEIACWADDIKKTESVYKGENHYLNKPYYDGINPSETKSSKSHIIDAVEFLKETRSDLVLSARNNIHPSKEDSESLKEYIHVFQDIHQPLHTISRYHPGDKNGDNGGNQFQIQGGYLMDNLHSLWDQTAGKIKFKKRPYTRRSFKSYEEIAHDILTEYPERNIWTSTTIDPDAIALESYQNAIDYAYKDISEGENPKAIYINNLWRNSKLYMATAAYRLKEDLTQIYSSSSYILSDVKTEENHELNSDL